MVKDLNRAVQYEDIDKAVHSADEKGMEIYWSCPTGTGLEQNCV